MPELSIWVIANKSTLTLLAPRPSINARSRSRKDGEDSISTRPDRYTRAPSLFSTMLMPSLPSLWLLLLCKGNLSFQRSKGFSYGIFTESCSTSRTLEWYWQMYGHNEGVVIPRSSSICARVALSVPRDDDHIRAADPIGAGSVMGRAGRGVFWVPGPRSCETLLSNNDARADTLHDALDHSAFTGSVSSFENDHNAGVGRLDPILELVVPTYRHVQDRGRSRL